MRRQSITPELVVHLTKLGKTQEDIAAMFGVSQSYVSKLKMESGFKTPREKVLESIPWSVRRGNLTPRQARNTLYDRLKDHVVREHNVKLTADQRARLRKFYRDLLDTNTVIKFDPKDHGTPYNKYGGFKHVAREESDEDLIVRIDDNTPIPADQKPLWTFPARMP